MRAVLAVKCRPASTQQLLRLVAEAEGLGGQEVARSAKAGSHPGGEHHVRKVRGRRGWLARRHGGNSDAPAYTDMAGMISWKT